ncbi:FAD-dependent monooxygenase [Rathayibacter tritici]|uniref:FAD-binding domain-containing protein n=1 Tax=Rathayibacter tritici TaxID=33888 RepID=A0A160KP90_9MICO|nr:FAD-dependent monooxygenase [Rathayibacter tritici]AND15236.1 hypothetical protein A6122_0067 [Rathayibacter tritici]PPI40638.1 FAD-binding protein [Rathayibacter tritici]
MSGTSMPLQNEVPVLIVGAGPAGLMAAVELTRRAVPVRIIDRLPEASRHSKALGVWPRTFELFQRINPLRQLELAGQYQEGMRYYSDGRRLVTIPYTNEARATVLPQPAIERFLEAELNEHGIHVERGTELVSIDVDDHHASARALRHDGTTETISAGYLIGADGASSAVRKALEIPFAGATYPSTFVVVDATIDGNLDPALTHYFCSTRGILVISALPEGGVRFFTSAPRDTDPDRLDLAGVQRIIDDRGPGTLRLTSARWISAFTVHARQAARIRHGRAFLIGDAAHIHSPAGGQGLNTGIADAHNLAWKIARVHHHHAHERLLGTYELERHPIAEQIVHAADQQTRLWLLTRPHQIILRDLLLRAVARTPYFSRVYLPTLAGLRYRYDSLRHRDQRSRSTAGTLIDALDIFDVSNERLTSLRRALPDDTYTLLFDGNRYDPNLDDVIDSARRVGFHLRTLDRRASRLCTGPPTPGAIRRGRILLVRPDGYIAFAGRTLTPDRLAELTHTSVLDLAQEHA